MAEVRVTKQFKENYDLVIADWIESGDWTEAKAYGVPGADDEFVALGLIGLMRKYELADGPDRLRATLVNYTPDGKEQPAAIDSPKDRFDYWEKFFAAKAGEIRNRQSIQAGIELRMALSKRKAA